MKDGKDGARKVYLVANGDLWLSANQKCWPEQAKMESALQNELKKAKDEFMPRKFYIDKWNYKLTSEGAIDYSEGTEVQGPAFKKKR